MAGIIDFIKQQITPDTVNRISSEIGEDPAKTQQAINASVPLLAGAISTQVPDATQAGDDASSFGGLGDMISGGALSAAGAGGPAALGGALGGMLGGGTLDGGTLDGILGGSHESVQNDVSKASGIEPQKVMKLLTMLAPIALAAYTRHKQQGSLSATTPPGQVTQDGGILGDMIDRVT